MANSPYDLINPVFVYGNYKIRIPEPPKYMWFNSWDVDPPKPKPVYRFLEEEEIVCKGDEVQCTNSAGRVFDWSPIGHGYAGRKAEPTNLFCGNTYVYRRPIRMQDNTHRYLDVGEKIVEGDERLFRFGWDLSEGHLPQWKAKVGDVGFCNLGNNCPEQFRRQFLSPAKPELDKLPDDPNYFYLKAGEFTKAGDEVLLSTYEKPYWETVKNGNIGAIVSKFQANLKCYRRKKDVVIQSNCHHGDLTGMPIDNNRFAYFSGILKHVCDIHNVSVNTYEAEIKTLKDQLANAMAEINELKAKSPEEPRYRNLEVGETLLLGDECYDPDTKKWNKTCNAGKTIGHRYTVQLNGETPFQYRRKIG
jgi:hypothetical protein